MSDRLLAATRKGLFEFRRGGDGWAVASRHFVGDNCPMVLADPRDGAWYAALDHGHFGAKLHRSRDEGSTWEEIAVPTFPEQPDPLPEPPPGAFGPPAPWSLKLIWELQPGGSEQPGTLWCGTQPGGLFRSDDAGDSWRLVRSLWDRPERLEWFGGGADWPGIHTVRVDPRNADRVLIGISCGGAWLTEDGGASWALRSRGMRAEYMPPERAFDENIQDPHLIAMCRDHPDHLWAQHHNGIFHSTDGGVNWTECTGVEPSTFGFGVVVHPARPEVAWFVPALSDEKRVPVDGRVVVTRTRDGGESFEVLTDGLPQQDAWDLVFRHALDVDATGDRLAFGSTTGGAWISENGGDSWITLPARLPPVYTMRFI